CHAAGRASPVDLVVCAAPAERVPALVTSVTLMTRVLTPLLALAGCERKTARDARPQYRDGRNPGCAAPSSDARCDPRHTVVAPRSSPCRHPAGPCPRPNRGDRRRRGALVGCAV